MVEIRKNKREENLLKKRQVLPSSQPLSTGAPIPTSTVEKKVSSHFPIRFWIHFTIFVTVTSDAYD